MVLLVIFKKGCDIDEGKAMVQEQLMRPREAAEQLAVSRSTIYRWFWEGKLQGVKLSNRSLRILRRSVEEKLEDIW